MFVTFKRVHWKLNLPHRGGHGTGGKDKIMGLASLGFVGYSLAGHWLSPISWTMDTTHQTN